MQSFNSEANIMLEKHPLFVIFNKSVINDITSKCTIANVEANEMIIQEGKITNEEFYLLIEGKANVYIYDQQKKIFLLNTLSAGDVFGESVMFDGQNRGASVYAQVFSKLLIIPKHVIEQLMNKELLLQFIKNLHTQTITNLTKVNTKAIELGAVDNYFF